MTALAPYHRAADLERLVQDHPIGPAFESFARDISRDELFARQDRLFRRCVERAWRTGFYQRLWRGAGIEPGDIKGLDDLPQAAGLRQVGSDAEHRGTSAVRRLRRLRPR